MSADFRELQAGMTNWLRAPDDFPAPALEPRRLAIYRELVVGNLADFIGHTFPVLRQLLPEAQWQALLRGFLAGYRAQSPYFRDIAAAFREWLDSQSQSDVLAGAPWLRELAHFEWMESAAAFDPVEEPDLELVVPLLEADWPEAVPCLRAALWPLLYRWPVHALTADAPPGQEMPPAPTALLMFRDDEDWVQVLPVSPLAARLVERLQDDTTLCLRQHIEALAAEVGLPAASLLAACQTLLADWLERGVLHGWRAV